MVDYISNNPVGYIHLLTATLALLFGAFILFMKKGTKKHIRVGYLYVFNMFIMLITSLMIYRLFSGFGPFHFGSIFSLLTICFGMMAIIYKWPKNSWKHMHFSFMYWSVVGLYSAFVSELLTRIPETPFFGMVGIASFIIMMIGLIIYNKKKRQWKTVFGIK